MSWLSSVAPGGYLLGSASPWPKAIPDAEELAALERAGLSVHIQAEMLTGLPSFAGWNLTLGCHVHVSARHIPEQPGVWWVARSEFMVSDGHLTALSALTALILEQS